MNTRLLLGSIFARLARYRVKTLLMSLGIVISVLATVLILTVKQSYYEAFTSYVARVYPADGIVVLAGSGVMGGANGRSSLHLDDLESVAHSIGEIKAWDPMVAAGARDIKNGGNHSSVNLFGYSERAEAVRRRSVIDGEFFTEADVKRRAHVVLLGSTTAKTLFPDGYAVGSKIFIDNVPFVVKGILEPVGVDPHGGDQDDLIEMPYTTLMERILKVDFLSGAMIVIKDRNRSASVSEEIKRVLRERHNITAGQQDDFSVLTPSLLLGLVDRAFRTFNVFTPLIAGTAFLVSGLVILSMMLIMIRERTSELGLRKALGARPKDLKAQIMLEVSIVAIGACLIGLLLAKGGAMLIGPSLAIKFGIEHFTPTPVSLAVAVCATLVTAAVGALLPAARAARLDPVAALK